MPLTGKELARQRLERLSWLTDSSIPIPGLKSRIGIDPLIGLIPWFGDAVGAVISSYILAEAARLGAPRSVLLRMVFNVGLDAAVGVIPFMGDLFDFFWKANQRNVRLLGDYIERPRRTVAVSRVELSVMVLLLIAVVVLIGAAGAMLVRAIWQALT